MRRSAPRRRAPPRRRRSWGARRGTPRPRRRCPPAPRRRGPRASARSRSGRCGPVCAISIVRSPRAGQPRRGRRRRRTPRAAPASAPARRSRTRRRASASSWAGSAGPAFSQSRTTSSPSSGAQQVVRPQVAVAELEVGRRGQQCLGREDARAAAPRAGPRRGRRPPSRRPTRSCHAAAPTGSTYHPSTGSVVGTRHPVDPGQQPARRRRGRGAGSTGAGRPRHRPGPVRRRPRAPRRPGSGPPPASRRRRARTTSWYAASRATSAGSTGRWESLTAYAAALGGQPPDPAQPPGRHRPDQDARRRRGRTPRRPVRARPGCSIGPAA